MRRGLHLPSAAPDPEASAAAAQGRSARATLNSWANVISLASGSAVLATGLILFTRFHVGPVALRMEWLGLSRLSWVNLHRGPSVAFLAASIFHIILHWRPILFRLQRLWPARPGRLTRWDAALYLGFSVVAVSGLAAWFLVPGSPPLSGPVIPTAFLPPRHRWIDVHNLTALAFSLAVVVHIKHHWCWFPSFIRRLKPRGVGPRPTGGATMIHRLADSEPPTRRR